MEPSPADEEDGACDEMGAVGPVSSSNCHS